MIGIDGLLRRADRPALLLAPMAGVSDRAFRQLCLEEGADLCCTEMISAQGLAHGNGATREMLTLGPRETTVAVQLFGHDPSVMAREAAAVEEKLGERLALIDINMGCPVRKVVSKGEGCALMRTPERAETIVREMARAVAHPVTVKLRRGWSPETVSVVSLAPRLEQAGAAALTIHGRFGTQGYRGRADWEVIAAVKAQISIPVIGNGDIVDGESARRCLGTSHCDALMIGRAAIGAPWLFGDIAAMLEGRPLPAERGAVARLEAARRLCTLTAELEPRHLLRLRSIAGRFVAGLPQASRAREAFNECSTIEDFLTVIDALIARAAKDPHEGVAANDR